MRCLSKSRRLLLALLLLAPGCEAPVRQAAAPSAPSPPVIERRIDPAPGARVESRMKGGETHAYLLPMAAGQYAGVVVDQHGIDVAVTLRDPSGRLLASVDSPSPQGAWVPEPIPFIATVAGTWRVEVHSSKDAPPGGYAVRLEALRPATPREHTLVRAERLLSQGEVLGRRDDRKSRETAAARAREAARLFQELDEPGREADACYLLGGALYWLDDNPGARDAYERALELFREVARQRDAVRTLNALGRTWRQEDPEHALKIYREALAISRGLGDRRQEATTLLGQGRIHQSLGEAEEALAHYERALPQLEARSDRAATLLALGDLYQRMGEPRKALEYLPQALSFFRAEGSRVDEATTLTTLGDAQARAGKVEEALASLRRAREIQRQIGQPWGEALALNSIGCSQLLLSRPVEARRSLASARSMFRQIGARSAEAVALVNLGLADEQLDRPRQAIESFEKALPVLVRAGSRDHEALALYGLARAHRRLGNLDTARQAAEKATGLIESLRGEPASLGMRASFLASKQDYYGVYVDLLMELDRREPGAGYDALALAASEQARARSLLDLLAESGADLREGVDPGLLAREADLARRINAADARRRRAPSVAAEAEMRELLTRQDRVEAAIRRTSPGYASLALPRPLTLREIQRDVVDGGTVFLQYALGQERSFLWAVTPDSLTSFVLPPGREIERAAREVHGLLSRQPRTLAGERTRQALAGLSDLLLGQAAGLLEGKRLAVVPDGALHHVPFAALPSPGSREPLVARHEVVMLPSASSLAAIRREARAPAPGTLAVVAPELDAAPDPVRVAAVRGRTLERIPFSREEAEALLAQAAPAERLGILGPEASREAVLSGKLAPYRLIHFATHGILDEDEPALSRLLLSQGSLYAHEVYHLRLSADLVVLSACRTGLGQEIRGEGLVGLTRGFLHAGARGVVVSLWDVDDLTTAELMRRFYRGMLKQGLPPAAALRAAQASLRQEPGWKEPYFWAGFVLQGDWQAGR